MEDEISMAEEGQDAGSSEGESGEDVFNSSPVPPKTGRANPEMSKQLQVCITHVNLSELGSHISNDGATVVLEKRRGRGRPKKFKAVEDPLTPPRGRETRKGPGSMKWKEKKFGRPKGSRGKLALRKAAADEAESEDDVSNEHKPEGGEEDNSSSVPSKRGRPKGSANQGLLIDFSESSEEEGIGEDQKKSDKDYSPNKNYYKSKVAKRGKGRPKKVFDDDESDKEYRPNYYELKKRIPRKHPVRPKKSLGRPRKYPRVDPPESTTQTPRRSIGRPPKVRKNMPPAASSPPGTADVGSPRKRGRPPRVKKSTIADELQPESAGGKLSSAVDEEVEKDGEIVSQEDGECTDPPESTTQTPPRSRGRPPKVRKNMPPAASSPPGTADVGPPRKRGRPPRVKKSTIADELQPESAGEKLSSAVDEEVEKDGEIVSQEDGESTDPPESTTQTPQRSRGRPPKVRKITPPAASSPPGTSDVGPPRKRGRPPGTIADELQPESAGEKHSSAVDEEVEKDGEIVSQEDGGCTED